MSNLIYQGKRVNFAGKQIKTPALHTDLVGYWKLDEADGSVYDSYGNFHGSILNAGSGVIQNQPGKINNAYQFNRDSSGAVYLPMEQFYAYQPHLPMEHFCCEQLKYLHDHLHLVMKL